MTLREERIYKDLTQKKAAEMLGVSLRSYVSYENDPALEDTIKYKYFVHELAKYNVIDETHGILSQKQIIEACNKVLKDYDINYCYLFGSYAKGKATARSDVDLLVSTETTGLRFYEMAEWLREGLHKKVDLLDAKQLVNNEKLIHEVLKEGFRIYR